MVSPYVPNVLALSLLAEAGNESQHALLAEAAAGQHKFALAALEPEARYRLADVQCHAEHIGSDYRLTGHKTAVHFGSVADTLIVTHATGTAHTASRYSWSRPPKRVSTCSRFAHTTVVPARRSAWMVL